MYYVYLIQNEKSKEIYIGFTNNLRRRLVEHNTNKSRSTKNRGAWFLIYAEMYKSKEDAEERENRLKYYGRALAQLKRRLDKSLLKLE
jgi:putative endonuclease